MSAATAAAATHAPEGAAPSSPARGRKKLIVIATVAIAVLALLAVGAVVLLKQRQAAALEGEEPVAAAEAEHEPEIPPTFVPLEMFTVNLADRDTERYAQIGVTLALHDPQVAEVLESYLPAVRNNILLLLAHKTAQDLLAPEGKTRLAAEIRQAAERAVSAGLPAPEVDEDAAPGPAAAPIAAVYFSNFIIQ